MDPILASIDFDSLNIAGTYKVGKGLKVFITNFGTYHENFEYAGWPLRLGWSGFWEKRNKSRFTFWVEETTPDSLKPTFCVQSPSGQIFRSDNPTTVIRNAGFNNENTKVSGPILFLLRHGVIGDINRSKCSRCQCYPTSENQLERYVLQAI